MKVPLCGEQNRRAVVDRRAGDEFYRSPANYFYVCCQREEGHEGEHIGQWFGQQIHWSVEARVEA